MRAAFWHSLLVQLRAHGTVALALVAEASHHSPGTAGARLWVTAEGQRGTIGGGAMEKRLLERARAVISSDFQSELQNLEHRAGSSSPSGLICAGHQNNLLYLCRPHDEPALARLVEILATDRPGRLILDSRTGLTVESQDRPRGIARDLQRNAEQWRYEEEILERRRVAIFGAGHCGLALARAMNTLGWRVSLWDTRASVLEGAEEALDSEVAIHCVDDFIDAGSRVDHRELTAAVIMTTNLAGDVRSLEGCLPLKFPFIGVMGAKAKLKQIQQRLQAVGLATEIPRLTAPVGLAIDSDTPEEIAVSVAAQLLRDKKHWLGDEKLDA